MEVNYLYHLTNIENLENILEHGLLSRNDAISEFIFFENIADPEVLNRGEYKKIFDKYLFDFVRLYFNPKNPMLYKRKEIQDKILILCIDRKALLEKDTIFSDGNASSSSTKFYKEFDSLKNLDWKTINAKFWNYFQDGKRKICAVVLVYSKIPISRIRKILCNNLITKNKVIELMENKLKIVVEVNENYYF